PATTRYLSCAPSSVYHLHPLFFFTATATTGTYTLSLHDALPISDRGDRFRAAVATVSRPWRAFMGAPRPCAPIGATNCPGWCTRSEEHTSELQSRENLVCRLLLEKKKKKLRTTTSS